MKKLLKLWTKLKSEPEVTEELASVLADDRVAQQLTPTTKDLYSAYLNHLKYREGEILEVYRDSLGYLTAGVGHLLNKDTPLREGDPITQLQSDYWLYSDAQLAWDAALEQMGLLGLADDNEFVVALACVNFQLGVNWYTIHKRTWQLMSHKEFTSAAIECEDSKWFKQTPVRVMDFQAALRKLAHEQH